jgi:hypothetical protein
MQARLAAARETDEQQRVSCCGRGALEHDEGMQAMRYEAVLGCALAAAACVGWTAVAQAASSTVVGFDGGSDGGFSGNAFFEASGGNPDGAAHFALQTFGIELRTGAPGETTNPDFLGDYSGFGAVTFSVDVKVTSLVFQGNQIARELGIELLDYDVQGPDGPAGVYFLLDYISLADYADWHTLSVTLDPSQMDLPPGWIGFGDYDPVTFEPMLPDGATFASVLAGVDEFRLTSFQPGYFYGNTGFNVRVDNLSVSTSAVPVPGAVWLLASGLAALARRRR